MRVAVFISACFVLTIARAPEAWSAVIKNDDPECPPPFQPMYTQCVLVKTDKKTWVEAKDDCVSNYGADLAEVKDLSVFTSYLVEKHLEADALLWVGGSDAHAENDWTWPSGTKVNPFYWAKNQPDNWQEEHCMNIDKAQFHLNDLDCTNTLGYICEKVFKSSIVDESSDSSEELECPEGFFIPPGSSHQCLKFFGEKRLNWHDANIKCGENGLRLAKPFNALALRAYLVERYGPDARVHVGARGIGSKMVWEHDGRELGAENTLWRNSQPGNKVTASYCLEISAREHEMNQEPTKPYWPGLCSVEIFPLCEYVE